MTESLHEQTKRAVILYDTQFGNTEKIGKALELGLRNSGVSTVLANVNDVSLMSLKDCDLVALGGPTQAFSASKAIKQFVSKLDESIVRGKYCFAFDTKLDSRLSGSAAKYIEKNLENRGARILLARESAIVRRAGGKPGDVELLNTEEARFQKIGADLGKRLLEKASRALTA